MLNNGNMKITDIKVHGIAAQLERAFWMSLEPYTMAAEIIVEVETDAGVTGIGQIHGRPMETIAAILNGGFKELLMGEDPLLHERIWQRLFSMTHSREWARFSRASGQPHFGGGNRPQMLAALAGIDLALWDIKGKAAGLPLWRMLGGQDSRVPCYASGGYYEEDAPVERQMEAMVEEMTGYARLGYPAVKMKVGGMSIAEDYRRIEAVRRALPDVDIMLDANMGYDVNSAVRAARTFEPLGIRWFEEPVHWYDWVFGVKEVARSTTIPIAAGESQMHLWDSRDLILHGGIRIMQFDSTRAGGLTELLRIAAYAAAHGVLLAPHHDPQIHGHVLAALSNGHIQEVFPNPVRDPLWEQLFIDLPRIENGVMEMNEKPGFGFELNREAMKRFAYPL